MTRLTSRKSDIQSIGSESWKRLVSSGAYEMEVNVTAEQMDLLIRFAQMLLEWNQRFNLTAITDPEEVAVKHFIDSMAAIAHIPETGSLLDIGSGGGFPGLVIAIFRPSVSITSIDSVRKKISFQQHLIRTLNLSSARALHTRAENLPEENMRYDVIVSRALGSLDMFLKLSLPMLSEEGRVVAYRGVTDDAAEEEIEDLKAKHPDLSFDNRTYLLPSFGDRRSMVYIKKQ